MATWKKSFQQGVQSFREGRLEDALTSFTAAIASEPGEYTLYDSRAAVYQRLQRFREALLDSKNVIDLAPDRWQGYSRSAHLFLKLKRFTSSLRMVDLALERLTNTDAKRRSELLSLKDQITTALEEKQKEASRTADHFGKLPLEIAGHIFSLVLNDNHSWVVQLAQVSTRWRAAILETPSLWGILVLSHRNPAKKARLWKQRSKGRVVELCIREQLHRTPWALDELRNIDLDALRTLRIEHFSVRLLRSHLPAFSSDILRNLDVLEVDRLTSSDTSSILWLWSEPEMQLQSLTVQNTSVDWPNLAENVRRLRRFAFQGPLYFNCTPDVLWLLHSNPELSELKLYIDNLIERNSSGRDPPDTVRLPRLLQLELQTVSRDQTLNNLLLSLELPALRTLRISKQVSSLDASLTHLLHSQSASSLTELRINRCHFSSSAMIQLLRSTPVLEILELSLIGGNQANVVLEALATPQLDGSTSDKDGHPSTTTLCPAIRHLDLSHCPCITGGPLIRLVKLRLPHQEGKPHELTLSSTAPPQSVEPITTLIIDGCTAVDAEILPWLRSQVPKVSCVYFSKENASWKR
ncbi:hypothetical protein CERSUDRAFT_120822 [Gelatoporia subvermispora B]|uniref:F-box domain-containing protein n=1 Tax=Ceriporiopsis subvermispora (strain B) TaxID=914234 RepID=M2RSP3_CERS8|nr:hypothetical protein CERSUDRAFT_120822 [Gelatoporia subvermispora B]